MVTVWFVLFAAEILKTIVSLVPGSVPDVTSLDAEVLKLFVLPKEALEDPSHQKVAAWPLAANDMKKSAPSDPTRRQREQDNFLGKLHMGVRKGYSARSLLQLSGVLFTAQTCAREAPARNNSFG